MRHAIAPNRLRRRGLVLVASVLLLAGIGIETVGSLVSAAPPPALGLFLPSQSPSAVVALGQQLAVTPTVITT